MTREREIEIADWIVDTCLAFGAADTLTRWGAFNGIRPTETGERLLAALRAERRAA